ncbi:MAG TPA: polysaccharide biosynthesis/export family protein [Gemmataceae bacterium]|nr:polysaccharide biosynthesis/export family protein [Gemmataceae bacterium]
MRFPRGCRRFAPVCLAAASLAGTGCLGHDQFFTAPESPAAGLGAPANVPTELNMITLPPYAIGSPDILVIDVYTLPREALGPATVLSPQPISGQHLVRADGTVNLGVYGSVSVAGLTTDQAREAIRRHVYEQLRIMNASSGGRTTPPPDDPAKLYVAVDVAGYNSKGYYVITDGAGFGERVYRFPYQGHETVLDALSNINGLPEVGSKRYIWVARRTPHPEHPDQILPVDYIGLTQHGITVTNYQILPGDRVYVRADKEFRIDGWLQKILTPIERLMGVTLLGSSTVHEIQNKRTQGTGF